MNMTFRFGCEDNTAQGEEQFLLKFRALPLGSPYFSIRASSGDDRTSKPPVR
jgi:hypothetical protein